MLEVCLVAQAMCIRVVHAPGDVNIWCVGAMFLPFSCACCENHSQTGWETKGVLNLTHTQSTWGRNGRVTGVGTLKSGVGTNIYVIHAIMSSSLPQVFQLFTMSSCP